ncbi:MAG: PHP domain-containing protein [Acidobacteria bacterium]|jgi:DNA polymerase (family X)|nr:PHP domain-containing protein [Acidobacteriota bacterium]
MASVDRKEAARVLKTISTLLELHGENPHRVRALASAGRTVERLEGDLKELVQSGKVTEARGIGRGTAAVLAELVSGRKPEVLRELEAKTPPGVVELLSVAGLGPKRVRALWQDLGVTTPGELEYACLENRLVDLPGFGATSQNKVLEAVRFTLQARERYLLDVAWDTANEVGSLLGGRTGVGDALTVGEVRRACETVGVVELLVVTTDRATLGVALGEVLSELELEEPGVWAGKSATGVRCRVLAVDPQVAAAASLWHSAAERHLEMLQQRASGSGLRLGADGLWQGEERIEVGSEEELYERLGATWVPPELREGEDELERATAGLLSDLVRWEDIRGALHNHTTDSDGAATLAEMAAAAREMGWDYLGIADHSPAAYYANGLGGERLRDQWMRIDDWNREHPEIRLIKGLEADILPDGRLDVPLGCDEGLEYVVASVHSSFRLAEEAQTERILAAIRHPACRILGHPTGRLLLARPPYALDLERVLEECAERGIVVEINANAHRLDLSWRWARRALDLGVQLAINPDAHAVGGLGDVRWGVLLARKAGARRKDVVTTFGVGELAAAGLCS